MKVLFKILSITASILALVCVIVDLHQYANMLLTMTVIYMMLEKDD